MKRLLSILFAATLSVALMIGTAFADSNGSFNFDIDNTTCAINTSLPVNGSTGSLTDGTAAGSLTTSISTSNGQGVSLLITPSLVTGLFTNTQISKTLESSAEAAAVIVAVFLDGGPVKPETACVAGSPSCVCDSVDPFHTGANCVTGVTYDERLQVLQSNIFDVVSGCTSTIAGTTACNIDLILSTLAAHSFNFVSLNTGQGEHQIDLVWAFECLDTNSKSATFGTLTPTACPKDFAPNTAGACAGPGSLTVQQVTQFKNSL